MSEQLENKAQQHTVDAEEDETNLLDLLIVLVRYKKLVIGMPIVVGILAAVVSLLMTPIFTSTAKIMPPQQQSSAASAMLGQLGGLAGAAGITGLKNPNDLYVGILQSRTIADNLIKRFKLNERYEVRTMEDARSMLALASEIKNGKTDGLISVSVSDQDPKFAAVLANAYVDELTKRTQTMAISEASQRRLFFEGQLKEVKEQLADAEIALRNTQEKTGMIQPDGQVQAIIGNIARVKATIAAKEVQINAMRSFATGKNPDVVRAEEELRSLRAQLGKLEKNQSPSAGDFMVPSAKVPAATVEYVRGVRNVKYYETLFELMAKQYELAKIDEAKESSTIQLLDSAVPAEHRTKPKRGMITLVGVLGGAGMGILLAFLLDAYSRSRQQPENSRRWQELATAWKASGKR